MAYQPFNEKQRMLFENLGENDPLIIPESLRDVGITADLSKLKIRKISHSNRLSYNFNPNFRGNDLEKVHIDQESN
jgi:hypothetical protein